MAIKQTTGVISCSNTRSALLHIVSISKVHLTDQLALIFKKMQYQIKIRFESLLACTLQGLPLGNVGYDVNGRNRSPDVVHISF